MNINVTSSKRDAAISRCVENLESPNPRLRSQAAEDLGKLNAQEAVPELVEHLQDDVNTYVRSASAEALGRIGDVRAIFPLMDALRDTCSFVRRAAAIALGQMQAKEAQGALLNALDDTNFYVRRAAINAIGKLDIPDLGSMLIPFLETPDPRIRRTTAIALRRLNTREAIPTMIELLEDYLLAPNHRDLPVVKTLVVALGELEAREAVPVLERVTRGYVGVRSLTAKALGKIGDPQAAQALIDALQDDKSKNLQLASLRSLGKLGYRDAIPAVRPFLNADDPRLRRTAVLTLGALQDRDVTPKLLEMAKGDESPLVRPAAVEALGQVGDAEMIEKLLPFLDDGNAYLRAALAHALSRLDGDTPRVQEALQTLKEDKVRHVAIAAQRALDQCADVADEDAEEDSCPEPEKQHVSWLRRFLGRD
ncbi:MAG: HEAT repeat domain-containing protein [Anaerolineae bacterium]